MQALPAQMILHDGTVSNIDGTLIPIEFNGRLMQRGHTLSIVELGKRLLKAAREGDTDQVRELMGKGAPFTADWLGTSPLHFAALHNHLDTCEVLLRAGISRDSRTKVDRTPLHMASYNGHVSIVQVLLSNGADVDARDMLKMTSLHWAVQNGHAEVVTLLLRHGANSESVNKFDKTPLDIAIETSRIDILQLLQVITKDPSAGDPVEHIENIVSYADPIGMQLEDESHDMPEDITTKTEYIMHDDTNDTDALHESFEQQQMQINEHNSNIDLSDSMQILKDHGISFLPADNSSVVASAVENGHSLVLTETGKQVLNVSFAEVGKQVLNSTKPLVKVPMHKNQMVKLKGRKIITVTADQLLAMASSSKTVFKKLPVGTTISDKPVKRIVMNKNKFILAGQPNVIRRVKPEPQIHPDFECITRQLQEARRQAEEYKKMLKRKEEEAERYKKQLLSMSSHLK